MPKFKTRLIEQVSLKQIRDNRTYSIQAIIDATGLSRPTIDRWMKGTLGRLDYETVIKFYLLMVF